MKIKEGREAFKFAWDNYWNVSKCASLMASLLFVFPAIEKLYFFIQKIALHINSIFIFILC